MATYSRAGRHHQNDRRSRWSTSIDGLRVPQERRGYGDRGKDGSRSGNSWTTMTSPPSFGCRCSSPGRPLRRHRRHERLAVLHQRRTQRPGRLDPLLEVQRGSWTPWDTVPEPIPEPTSAISFRDIKSLMPAARSAWSGPEGAGTFDVLCHRAEHDWQRSHPDRDDHRAGGCIDSVGTTVTVSATAAPGSGTLDSYIRPRRRNLGTEGTSSPYSVSWNTTPCPTERTSCRLWHKTVTAAREWLPRSRSRCSTTGSCRRSR